MKNKGENTKSMKKTNLINLVWSIFLTLLTAPMAVVAQDETRCNCVLYARESVRSLPYNLHSTTDKHRIINSMFPRPGTVAIFSFNHVAVVTGTQVDSDGSIIVSINEANYKPCQIGTRRGKLSDLQIVGFFDPRFSSGNTPPRVRPGTTVNGVVRREILATISGEGFDPQSVQLILLGGSYCTSWGRCTVPTSVMTNRTSRTLTGPLTINSPGRYSLYVFNPRDGRSSNAIPVLISDASTSRRSTRPRF